jgi:hypothetical protein
VLVVETYPNLTFTFLVIPLVEYTLMNKRVLFMNVSTDFSTSFHIHSPAEAERDSVEDSGGEGES